MTQSRAVDASGDLAHPDVEYSLFALASVVLSRRRTILMVGFLGAAAGLASGLLSTRMYRASAAFIPQGAETGMTGLSLAASQIGLRIPSSSNGWGVPVYVELLHSRALLEKIALDTVKVEEDGRRISMMDLLKTRAPTLALRTELTVRALRSIVSAAEDRKQNAVNLSVSTRWPSVSLWVTDRLLREVSVFNVETRKSQARAERVFVESRTMEAEDSLRTAENRLQEFLQKNRAINNSSQLQFAQDRLQRAVVLRQQLYSSLQQSREDARIREVRDIPVITVIEAPRLPVISEPRKSLTKAVIGGAVGTILGLLLVLTGAAMRLQRNNQTQAADEFYRQAYDTLPAFLRKLERHISSRS